METKTLTFDPTNLTGPQDGEHGSEWTKYTELHDTDCGATEPKGNLGTQVVEAARADVWEDGYTIVGNSATVGNVRIDTTRGTQERREHVYPTPEKVGVLEQDVRVHRVTSIDQRRVRKGKGYVVRTLDITLEGGDKIKLTLFGDDVASVTINAKTEEVK